MTESARPAVPPSRAKRILFPILAALIALVVFAAALEGIATAYLYLREGTYVSARTRFQSRTNTFVEGLISNRDCGYVDTLYPHPYLGFVHHGNPPCGLPQINNIGLYGPDFPSSHRTDRFVILLTGGSVANQFGQSVVGGPPYLERILNERYLSPTGKPFLVLNGADGAWKQPQQTIIFLLYADAVDAVVTLDGFNEHYMIGGRYRFEYPASNFATVNPLATQHFGDIVAQWAVGNIRAFAAGNPILSRSEAAYALISAAQDYLAERAAARPKPRTTVESLFLLPRDWSEQQRKEWAVGQYRKYLRAMQAIADTEKVRTAFFIQPVPAVGKTLTAEERRVVGDLKYAGLYKEMANSLMALNADHIPVFSLLDVFDDQKITLYADPIHLARDDAYRSFGNELLAETVAIDLAQAWNLTRRTTADTTSSSR